MKIKTIVLIFCGLVAGSALGYVVGINRAPETKNDITASDDKNSARPGRFEDTKRVVNDSRTQETSTIYNNKSSIDSLLQKYSRMNPDQIQAEIKELTSGNLIDGREPDIKKLMSLVYLSYKWGQTSPQQALLESRDMGMISAVTGPLVMLGWAESDPSAAAAYYSENKKQIAQAPFALKMIAAEMAKNSPSAAMEWLDTLSEKERNNAFPSVISGIADAHPSELAAYVGKLSEEDLKNNALTEEIAAKWAKSDWDQTSEWIKSLPENQQKRTMEKALASLAITDLEKTTQQFKQLDEKNQSDAARNIVRSLSSKGGTEALDWLVKNSSESVAINNVSSAIGYSSSYQQNQEIKDYITSMPAGAVKDSSLADYVQKNSYNFFGGDEKDYESNLALAGSIGDESKRNSSVERTVGSWSREDPVKAKEWVGKSTLSQADKDKYIKQCDDVIARRAANK